MPDEDKNFGGSLENDDVTCKPRILSMLRGLATEPSCDARKTVTKIKPFTQTWSSFSLSFREQLQFHFNSFEFEPLAGLKLIRYERF